MANTTRSRSQSLSSASLSSVKGCSSATSGDTGITSATVDSGIAVVTDEEIKERQAARARTQSAPPVGRKRMGFSASSATSSSASLSSTNNQDSDFAWLDRTSASQDRTLITKGPTIANEIPTWAEKRASRDPVRNLTVGQQAHLQFFNWTQSKDPERVESALVYFQRFDFPGAWEQTRAAITAEIKEHWASVQNYWRHAREESQRLAREHEQERRRISHYVILEHVPAGLTKKDRKALAELLINHPSATAEASNGFVWKGQVRQRRPIRLCTWILEYASPAQATKAAKVLTDPVRSFCRERFPKLQEIQVHRLSERTIRRQEWATRMIELAGRTPDPVAARECVRVRQEMAVEAVVEAERSEVERKEAVRKAEFKEQRKAAEKEEKMVWLAVKEVAAVEQEAAGGARGAGEARCRADQGAGAEGGGEEHFRCHG